MGKVNLELSNAKLDMKEIKMERSDIKTLDDEAKADYDEWNLKFPNCARFLLLLM